MSGGHKRSGLETTARVFDVSGATAVLDQTLTAAVPGEVPAGDWAVNPVDGEIYGGLGPTGGTQRQDPGDLWRFEIVGNTLERVECVSDTTVGGTQWFISDGTFFSYLNAPGGIYPDRHRERGGDPGRHRPGSQHCGWGVVREHPGGHQGREPARPTARRSAASVAVMRASPSMGAVAAPCRRRSGRPPRTAAYASTTASSIGFASGSSPGPR